MPYKIIKIGIYLIRNIVNNHLYIGSSSNIYTRWGHHKRQLRLKIHHDFILQRAWDKYLEDSFIFEILEECAREDLISRENFYIEKYKPTYNLDKKATRSGAIVSKDTIRKALETRRKTNNCRKGRSCLPEEMERFMRLCHGSNHPSLKLNDNIIREIRLEYSKGILQKDLAFKFGVRQDHISRIINRKSWVHVE